jgi:hypothetical protein
MIPKLKTRKTPNQVNLIYGEGEGENRLKIEGKEKKGKKDQSPPK